MVKSLFGKNGEGGNRPVLWLFYDMNTCRSGRRFRILERKGHGHLYRAVASKQALTRSKAIAVVAVWYTILGYLERTQTLFFRPVSYSGADVKGLFGVTILGWQTMVLIQTVVCTRNYNTGLFGRRELQTMVCSNQHQFFDCFWHRVWGSSNHGSTTMVCMIASQALQNCLAKQPLS